MTTAKAFCEAHFSNVCEVYKDIGEKKKRKKIVSLGDTLQSQDADGADATHAGRTAVLLMHQPWTQDKACWRCCFGSTIVYLHKELLPTAVSFRTR